MWSPIGVALVLLAALVAAPALCTSARAADATEWANARTLADQGRFAESLAAIRAALAREPDDTGLLWLQAGVTSQAGDPEEAVRLYDALVATHPEMADDIALDRAEALTFADRFDEAEGAYERLLADDPHNSAARVGYARALNWGGRHREAARVYRQALHDRPTDADAATGLAFAEYWAGRNDLARQALASVPGRGGADRENLRQTLYEERRPSLTLGYGSSHDSDDLELRTGQLSYRVPVGESDAVFFAIRTDHVEDGGGAFDVGRMVWGHERVWSYAWQTHVYAGAVVEGAPNQPFVLDSWATFRPLDTVRLDAGVAREQVLTREALALEITYLSPALSLDWQVTRRWRARLAHRASFYSDDNRTGLTSGGVRYRLIKRRELKLDVGADASRLGAKEDLDDGYYDPRSYFEVGGAADLTWEPKPRWEFAVAGRLGRQEEQDAPSRPFFGLSGRLEAPLSRRLRLGLEGGRSDSNLSSASGYRRTSWGISLTTGF